jgi:hypothetical protein
VQFLRPTGRICPTVNTVAVAKSWKSWHSKTCVALHTDGAWDPNREDLSVVSGNGEIRRLMVRLGRRLGILTPYVSKFRRAAMTRTPQP